MSALLLTLATVDDLGAILVIYIDIDIDMDMDIDK